MLRWNLRLGTVLVLCSLSITLLQGCVKMEGDRVVPESLEFEARGGGRISVPSGRTTGITTWFDSASRSDHLCWLTEADDIGKERSNMWAFACHGVASLLAADEKTFRTTEYPGVHAVRQSTTPVPLGGREQVLFAVGLPGRWDFEVRDLAQGTVLLHARQPAPNANSVNLNYPCWFPPGDSSAFILYIVTNKQRANVVNDSLAFIDIATGAVTCRAVGNGLSPLRRGGYGFETVVRDSLLVLYGFGDGWDLEPIEGVDQRRQQLVAFNREGRVVWVDTLDHGDTTVKLRLAIRLLHGSRIVTAATRNDASVRAGSLIELHDAKTGRRLRERLLDERIVQLQSNIGPRGVEQITAIDRNGLVVVLDSTLAIRNRFDLDCAMNDWVPEQIGAPAFDVNADGVDDFFAYTAAAQLLVIDGSSFEPLLAVGDSSRMSQAGIIRAADRPLQLLTLGERGFALYELQPLSLWARLEPHRGTLVLLALLLVVLPLGVLATRLIDYFRRLHRLLTVQSETLGVVVIDARRRVKSYNNAARDMLDLPRAPRHIVLDEFPPAIVAMVHACLAAGIDERREVTAERSTRQYLTVSIVRLKAFGRRRGCLLTIVEATTHVEAELRRNALLLARSKAHEAKQPLGTLDLWFDAMMTTLRRSGTLPEGVDLYAERIRDELADARDQIRTITSLGDVAEFEPAPHDLVAVVRGWIAAGRGRYERDRITITHAVPDAPCIVSIDAGHVCTLLQCLCDNAANAMIDVPTRTLSIAVIADDEHVRLVVRDSGEGMDADTLERVRNQPYFTTRVGGSGFGMKIVRKVCSEHDAALEIDSRPGAGTSVTVSFAAGATS